MKKLSRYIQLCVLFAAPVAIALFTWASYQSDAQAAAMGGSLNLLRQSMVFITIAWALLLFVLMLLLAFHPYTQESVIKRIAGMKERDEREEIITGLAARKSFVATTGFLIFLFFLSCATVSIARMPNGGVDGKKASLTFGFRMISSEPSQVPAAAGEGQIIYEHRDIPISKSGIILLILAWQLAAFRIKARRELSGA